VLDIVIVIKETVPIEKDPGSARGTRNGSRVWNTPMLPPVWEMTSDPSSPAADPLLRSADGSSAAAAVNETKPSNNIIIIIILVMPRKEQQQQPQQQPPNSSSCCSIIRRRSWVLMIVIGLAMAVAMLIQQMVLVHNHESFWNDFNADWKVANFAQERHHYDDVENTNYTWVDEQQNSNNASIGNRSTAFRRRRIPRLQQLVLEQRARTASTANGSDVSNAIDENPWRTVLASAGVKVTTEQEKLLPELDQNWKELFGMEPIILGMETVRTWGSGLVRSGFVTRQETSSENNNNNNKVRQRSSHTSSLGQFLPFYITKV
jgi:hypothetical protein